jgi:tetratricopeptide (TPR) repeat protein
MDILAASPATDPGLATRLEEVERRLSEIERPGAPPAEATEAPAGEVALLPSSAADMTAEELAYQGRVMMGRRDYGTALAYWQAVLDGDPDEERRNEALYQSGLAYRMLKDHEKEEAAFREWAAAQEPGSAGEMSALFQVAWSLYYQKKPDEALDVMERVARSEGTHEATRPYALYHTANFAFSSGDYARARPYLVRLLEEFGESEVPNHAWVLARAKELLKQIDGG